MRRHYAEALIESEDAAQRLMSLSVGLAAFTMLITAPVFGHVWSSIWLGMWTGLAAVGFATRRRTYEGLRHTLLMALLNRLAPLELEIWDRLARLKHVPAPISQYIERFLGTYIEFKQHVRDDDKVDLGQVQLAQAREHVMDFLDLAERTGAIRNILETMSHRISDDDQIRLRQRFSEQCAGLQEITQTFDRSLGNLVVAQVLGDDLGETTMEYVQERMSAIEEEFDEVKQSLVGGG
ncbi:MAG: hypothetical protein HZB16_24055 [Armatimonadetes bacterium]|nr:hypothetical protein [Armatimonadota bacterium]